MAVPPEKDEKAICKHNDVIGSRSKRRYFNLDDIEAIKKVLPKPTFPNRFLQIYIRCCDDSHVGMAGYVITDALIFLVLDKTQELRLKKKGKVTDFIQKERPAVAGADATGIVAYGAGKGALDMSKELAFEELRRWEGQERTLKGMEALRLQVCIALASTLFPVPLSPRSRIVASDGAV